MKNLRVSKLVLILFGIGLVCLIGAFVALYLEKENEIKDILNADAERDLPGFDKDRKDDPVINAVRKEFPDSTITDSHEPGQIE